MQLLSKVQCYYLINSVILGEFSASTAQFEDYQRCIVGCCLTTVHHARYVHGNFATQLEMLANGQDAPCPWLGITTKPSNSTCEK